MLQTFVRIRKRSALQSASTADMIVGSIAPRQNELDLLKQLAAAGCLDPFAKRENGNISIEDIVAGDQLIIKLYPLNLKATGGKYFEHFDDFVNANSQRQPNYSYYIFSLDYWSTQADTPLKIKQYRWATEMIMFLNDLADYSQDRNGHFELVFFQRRKLVITTKYAAKDLEPLNDPTALINSVNESIDQESRRTLFVNELISFLSKTEGIHDRFKQLLAHIDDVRIVYNNSRELYLEQYSFDKIRGEIDKETLDASKRIQSVINDAQTKLVAIPAATLIVMGQFDLSGGNWLFNLSLVTSSIIFSVLLHVLLLNQFSALKFINDDVERFKTKFQGSKIKEFTNDFSKIFENLAALYKKQKRYLAVIRILVWSPVVISTILFVASFSQFSFLVALVIVIRKMMCDC